MKKNIIHPDELVKWFLLLQEKHNVTYLNVDIEGEPNERIVITLKAFIENPNRKIGKKIGR